MDVEIVNREEYTKTVCKAIKEILNSDILSIDPFKLSDEQLLNSIHEFVKVNDSSLDSVDNLCTWVYVGKPVNAKYIDSEYTYIPFYVGGKEVFKINFSNFKYYKSPKKMNTNHFSSFDYQDANYISKIDDKEINPEEYFSNVKEGDKFLYLYSTRTVNAYNKQDRCFYLAKNDISPAQIRSNIIKSQRAYMDNLYANINIYLPNAVMKIGGVICHNQKHPIAMEFAQQIVVKEYGKQLDDLYKTIEDRYNIRIKE